MVGGVRSETCQVWDLFLSTSWVGFFQLLAGLLATIHKRAAELDGGAKLTVRHLVGDMHAWLKTPLPPAWSLARTGRHEVGAARSTLVEFMEDAQEDLAAGTTSFSR